MGTLNRLWKRCFKKQYLRNNPWYEDDEFVPLFECSRYRVIDKDEPHWVEYRLFTREDYAFFYPWLDTEVKAEEWFGRNCEVRPGAPFKMFTNVHFMASGYVSVVTHWTLNI